MSDKPALQSIVGQYYSNILLTDPKGVPLTTISSRRAKWYLDRGLGIALGAEDGYTERVQLTFEPKSRNSNAFLKAILPTQCVVCGSTEGLTLHHVIPMAVKRFFPEIEKDHTRQWCVLVCEEHHLQAEAICRPYYERSLQAAVKAVQASESEKHKLYYKLINMLYGQNMFLENVKAMLTPDEKELIGSVLDDLKASDAYITKVRGLITNQKEKLRLKVKQAKKDWGEKYIADMGGIEKVKEVFRDCFLQLKPAHLPEGFLVDIELLDADEKPDSIQNI